MNVRNLFCAAAVGALMAAGHAAADPADQPGHHSPAPGTSNDTVSAVKDEAGYAVGLATAEMTTTLKGFVQAAAISDMYEVEAGKIAEQRTQNPRIKEFAEEMVKAHTETTAELKQLLAAPNILFVPPAHLDDRRQGMIDELRGAKNADFDGRYIAQQVDAHQEALALMKGYAGGGDIASIKHFAAETAPIVQSHLDMAQHLAQTRQSQR